MKFLFRYIVRICIVLLLVCEGAGLFAQVTPTCRVGSITPSSFTIAINTSPGTLTANPVNCSTTILAFSWYASTDGQNYSGVGGGRSYTPGPISVTTWYYYKATKLDGTSMNSPAITVSVSTLAAGSIAMPVSAVHYNQTPGVITGTDATGAQGTFSYQWESSYDGFSWTVINGAVSRDYTPGKLLRTISYRRKVTDENFSNYSNVVTITVYPEFAIGNIGSSQVVRYGNAGPVLQLSSVAGGDGVYSYQWFVSNDGSAWNPVGTAATYDPGTITTKRYFKLNVTSFGLTRTSNIVAISSAATVSSVPAPSVATGAEDAHLNWVIAKTFDDHGHVTGEHKTFYDLGGQLLQQQSKKLFRKDENTVLTHVFATQPVKDAYGNNALNSMGAPIDRGDFAYKADFIQDANNTPYSNKNFDKFNSGTVVSDKTNNPDPVGSQPGTLGWYYSTNNNWEPYVPNTSYPYLRSTALHDGSFAPKLQAGAGDVLHMGLGREASQYKMPASNELDFYIQVRNKFFANTEIGATPGSIINQAVQEVVRDVNGKEAIIIQDKNGKVLMTAKPGTELMYNNVISVQASGVRYFYLSQPTAVNIQGINWQLYNMGGDESSIPFSSGNNLPAGYYKLTAGNSPLLLRYQGGVSHIGYQFYNQLGQLVASIAPEGVKKLEGNGINNYTAKESIPFITLNYYDQAGRLIKTSSTNSGITKLVYATDGKLRFSQNAVQATSRRYSYILYDGYGRLIETGEYEPDVNGGIAFNPDLLAAVNPMRDILDKNEASGDLINGTKTDVAQSLYDVPDNSHGLTSYIQATAFLGGKVSMTRKYSRVINNTPSAADLVSSNWYSYTGDGNLEWGIQFIQGMGYKTSDFYYDNMGRLSKKIFQKDIAAETFVHYYEFDPATQQLWKVFTNTADVIATRQLQATYYYYLHGPLKRIELGGDLQGIDYTYTLEGQLKAINNSNKANDPGEDGNGNAVFSDAFGMVLDYFPGDYQNGRLSGIKAITGVDVSNFGTYGYNGSIKAMTWFSKKPAAFSSIPKIEDPATYVFQYDDDYQFTESTWGTDIGINAPGSFNATNFNKEIIKNPANGHPAYDANGNILYLQRTDGTGAVSDNFTYNYLPNTDKLLSVVHNASTAPETYAQYTYDQLGQLTGETNTFKGINSSKYIEYDMYGKVVAVYRDAAKLQSQLVVAYMYDENGARIVKKSYAAGQLSQITYYAGSVIFTQVVANGTPGAITAQEYEVEGAGGRLGTFYRQVPVYAYELTDHQGNVRAIIAKSASNALDVRMYTDYYPFGMAMRGNSQDYRYGYQGQYAEKDGETDWNAFELRMYDSRVARWLSVDPYDEFWTPYMGMANDPVNGVDPDGGSWWDWLKAHTYALFHGGEVHHEKNSEGMSFYNVVKGTSDGISLLKSYRDYDYVAKGSYKATVGVQLGWTVKTPVGELKIDGKLISYEIGSGEYDFIKNKYTAGQNTMINYQHNGINTEQSLGLELDINQKVLAYKYKKTFLTEPTYNGVKVVPNTMSYNIEQGVYQKIKLYPTKKSPTDPPIDYSMPSPSVKYGAVDDGKFFGLDIGTSMNAILGVEWKLKLGWYY